MGSDQVNENQFRVETLKRAFAFCERHKAQYRDKVAYTKEGELVRDLILLACAGHPFGYSLDEMDTAAFFNMRDWLQKAVEAQGAKMVGGGIGMGQADIDIDLDGCRYSISIRPLP
jgi:hypothetical protein